MIAKLVRSSLWSSRIAKEKVELRLNLDISIHVCFGLNYNCRQNNSYTRLPDPLSQWIEGCG